MAKYGYLHWVKQMKLVHFFLSGIYWVSSMFNAYASYTFPLRIIACSSSLFLCNTKFYRKKESVIINRFKNLNRPKFRYISRIFNENGSLKQPYLRNGLTDFRFCPISKLAWIWWFFTQRTHITHIHWHSHKTYFSLLKYRWWFFSFDKILDCKMKLFSIEHNFG